MIVDRDIDELTEEEQAIALKQLRTFNDLIATCRMLENSILVSEALKRTIMIFVFTALAVVATSSLVLPWILKILLV